MRISRKLQLYTEKFGLIKGYFFYKRMGFIKEGKMKIPNIKFPVYFRPKTIDIYTIDEIFGFQEYNFKLDFEPRYIIDGGANIGFTSVYFANKYPKAQIISVEPEDENFRLLEKNIRNYPNIRAVKGAVWADNTLLEVKDNGFGLRGFMVEEVREKTESSFQGFSINDLLPEKERTIDILKLDIEGSEKIVFEKNFEIWLPRVKCLVIELHDRMVKGCSRSVFKALSNFNFSFSVKGENLIFINEDLD